MYRKIVLLGFLTAFTTSLMGQTYEGKPHLFDVNTNPNQVLDALPLPPAKVLGSDYLNENWTIGNIQLKKNEIQGYPLRYDLQNKLLEVKVGNEVKVCNLSILKGFDIANPETGSNTIYINSDQFKYKNDIRLLGIMELVYDGEIKLFAHPYLVTIKASYNEALGVGNRNDRIVKKERYFVEKDGLIYEAPKNKKEALVIFPEMKSQIEDFFKSKKGALKDREAINLFVLHLNTTTNQ